MDEEGLGSTPALPVATDVVSEFELSLPPANGMDYLKRVRYDQKWYVFFSYFWI